MRHLGKILGGLLLVSGASLAAPLYSGDDKMAVPPDYRAWVFLTSSLDMSYLTTVEPGQHLLDNVFVNPEAYAAFLKTGTWPEQTVLVKENRLAETAGTLSKRGYFQTGIKDLEIHLKDSRRFPGGWAFFVSADGRADGKLKPQSADCYSCHQAHGAVDTTFVQFYPTLMPVAKDRNTLSTDYLKNDKPSN